MFSKLITSQVIAIDSGVIPFFCFGNAKMDATSSLVSVPADKKYGWCSWEVAVIGDLISVAGAWIAFAYESLDNCKESR